RRRKYPLATSTKRHSIPSVKMKSVAWLSASNVCSARFEKKSKPSNSKTKNLKATSS
ncbi:HAMP domain protein, partial [Vibrio parahaemolyticus V-223/04]